MKLTDTALVLKRDGAGWYIDSTGEHYAQEQQVWHTSDVVSFNARNWRLASTGRFVRMDRSVRIV